jgi:hypothetical protein
MAFTGNFMCTSFKKELLQGLHNFYGTFTDATVDTSNTDATVTMDSTANIRVGMHISGTGIPSGAKVASITNGTTFEMSDAATASGTNITATFSGDVYKIALYDNSASFTAATTVYTSTNEVANGDGYTTGGNTLTNVTPTSSSTTALTDFADTTWSSSTITARGALIYNSSNGYWSGSALVYPAAVVLDFGSDKTSTNGDFTVVFPTADASSAIIRIA